PARYPEFPFVCARMLEIFVHIHGKVGRVRDTHARIMRELSQHLTVEYRKSEVWRSLTQKGKRKKRASTGPLYIGEIRPGLLELTERLVSRCLMFLILRECHDVASCQGYHLHGERAYYARVADQAVEEDSDPEDYGLESLYI
ncbi:hypothetical protein LTR53_013600, partial [Teratosphaeriaceae sp. CCFEE 6253]